MFLVTPRSSVRAAGVAAGPETVAKALADMTAAGELVNPKDKKEVPVGELDPPPGNAEPVRGGLRVDQAAIPGAPLGTVDPPQTDRS